MTQMTLDDLLEPVPISELHCCSLSAGFHWLKITSGYTPIQYIKHIEFQLDGFDHMYKNTVLKDEIISAFDGIVKNIEYVAS